MAEPFDTLTDLFERSCAKFADRPLFGERREGRWEWIKYRELHELVSRARAGLAHLGVSRGDRVAIVCANRVEWAAVAYATYGLGAALVPMYLAQRPKERRFILEDSGAKVAIVAGSIFDEVSSARPASLLHVVGLDRPAGDPSSWLALLEAGARAPTPPVASDPKEIADFIYTSGTTGNPKGVLLSHQNIASNVSGVHEVFAFEPSDRSLSFLPWAHAYGQTCEVHGLLSMGCSVAINDELPRLLENLKEVKPTILLAVPSIFDRIYESVNAQIAARPGFVQKIIRTGISGAIKRSHGEFLGSLERIELAAAEKLVFAKIREKLGGRLKYVISASATLSPQVAEFIDAIGLTVYEGYGLTETSPIVSANFPGRRKLGSVGRPIAGVRVMIEPTAGGGREGEIIVYGPNVMVGYHQRPEENEKVLTKHGGLRTGDLGFLDEDGFLHVTGRIKEQYKLENGKYVMPSPLEQDLQLSPYIANVMLYGEGRPHNVALVVLDERAVRAWAEHERIELADDITTDPRVRSLVRGELVLHGQNFKTFEQPHDFVLVREDFTIENGLLTPTLKVRRRDVLARYRAQLDALYPKRAWEGGEAASTRSMASTSSSTSTGFVK